MIGDCTIREYQCTVAKFRCKFHCVANNNKLTPMQVYHNINST